MAGLRSQPEFEQMETENTTETATKDTTMNTTIENTGSVGEGRRGFVRPVGRRREVQGCLILSF